MWMSQVQPNSPSDKKLFAFFDFIVKANDTVLVRTFRFCKSLIGHVIVWKQDQEDSRLVDLLFANVDKAVMLTVYSSKTDTFRGMKYSKYLERAYCDILHRGSGSAINVVGRERLDR